MSCFSQNCNKIHVCMRCGKFLPPCCFPPFACPWINEDEDQECEECIKITIKEMEQSYLESEKLDANS